MLSHINLLFMCTGWPHARIYIELCVYISLRRRGKQLPLWRYPTVCLGLFLASVGRVPGRFAGRRASIWLIWGFELHCGLLYRDFLFVDLSVCFAVKCGPTALLASPALCSAGLPADNIWLELATLESLSGFPIVFRRLHLERGVRSHISDCRVFRELCLDLPSALHCPYLALFVITNLPELGSTCSALIMVFLLWSGIRFRFCLEKFWCLVVF